MDVDAETIPSSGLFFYFLSAADATAHPFSETMTADADATALSGFFCCFPSVETEAFLTMAADADAK